MTQAFARKKVFIASMMTKIKGKVYKNSLHSRDDSQNSWEKYETITSLMDAEAFLEGISSAVQPSRNVKVHGPYK